MAKFKAILGDLRGKLAGNVFSRNSSSAYVRQKVTPVNTNTAAQQAARTKFGTNAQNWRGLTTDQRNTFISQAPSYPHFNVFGDSAPLTGQQLFMQLNNNLRAAGATVLNAAIPPQAIPAATATGLTSGVAAGTIITLLGATTALYSVIVQGTAPYSPGKKVADNQFRQLTVKSGVSAAANLNISAFIQSVFGVPSAGLPIGSAISVRIIGVNLVTGQTSVITTFTAIITA